VAKGANSVLQGFEGVSGQINVMTRNPEKEPNVYTNAYINNFGEWHLNANYSGFLGKEKKWSTLVGLHAVQPANRRDRDQDGFLDLPLLSRYSVFNRWNYGKENEKGFYTQFSFRFTDEQRIGGQRNFNANTDKGSTRSYGQTVNYSQSELIGKFGYRFSAMHSIQTQISGLIQKQDSYYGTLHYKGLQQSVNAILQHQWNWNEKNSLTWGASFRYQNLKETIHFMDTIPKRSYAGEYQTNLQVPGVFAEHTSNIWKDKITWITGARMDWHQTYGPYFTPRTLIKYELFPGHIIRSSIGTSWRQVNLFAENINLMASSRDVIFEEKLKPEQAVNWGLNYTHIFEKEKFSGSISTDFYQTSFQNQFFPDFYRNSQKAYIRNFTGTSASNAFQIETNIKALEVFEIKLAYNYVEVYRIENGLKTILPFNPENRVMTSLSYRPTNDRWYFDGNIHWYDKQRLPGTEINQVGTVGPEFSKAYAIFSGQITHKIKQVEIYGGVENIFDFRQLQPIVGWQNPFGPNFDTSTVWGPTRGREFYIGFRWRLEKKKDS
jgi:outer membrane receptor for ferrienterochelin and colicin